MPLSTATPMGTSPSSADGVAVFKAVIQNEKPLDAAEAISQGMQLTATGDFSGALELFEMALTLPGSGTLRDRKKARELSEGEKISRTSLVILFQSLRLRTTVFGCIIESQ
eukprot:1357920-Pyramimonas_sp.AAC.1